MAFSPDNLPSKLGILAGGGHAPRRLLDVLRQAGRAYHLICLQGQADADLGHDQPHDWLPLGAGAQAARIMREQGVRDIVLIGKVRRPSLFELRPDAFTLQKLLKVGFAMLGDDGLLQAIGKIIEGEGFRLVGIHEIYADFLTPAGQLGRVAPSEQDRADIARGVGVARQLGLADVGQAVVVQQGMVLGVEAIEGTDALIARCGALKRGGGGGVLVKLCKPQQDRRFDLPTMGPDTIAAVQGAGLAGIAIDAGASLLIDRDKVVAMADAAGLFVIGYQETGA